MKLPLEYNKLSKFFDAVGSGSTNAVNRLIGKILKKYKVKTVLDLTCGTGSQVFWLAKHGYKVTGSDFSPELLKIAKARLKKEKLNIKLFHGDMRTQKIGKFDAVVTIFNAIGHLTPKGFEKAMRNISQNLNTNGIYVFDIFNLNSLNSKDMSSLDMDITKKIDDTKIHIYQYSRLDKKNGLLVSYDNYTLQKQGEKPKKFKVKFPMQIYSATELTDMLNRNGFKVLEKMGRDGSRFSDKRTKEMLIVAQKIAG